MSLDSAVHWGGTEGLNPVQHKQYQCHHFFFYALACGIALP